MGKVSQFKQYLSDVRGELRKVVWPTRQETTSTTIVVIAMVILVSLFLWMIDAILASLVQLIVG